MDGDKKKIEPVEDVRIDGFGLCVYGQVLEKIIQK